MTTLEIFCSQCGKKFQALTLHLKWGGGTACSIECANVINERMNQITDDLLSEEDLILFVSTLKAVGVNNKEQAKKLTDSLTHEQLLQVKQYLNSMN